MGPRRVAAILIHQREEEFQETITIPHPPPVTLEKLDPAGLAGGQGFPGVYSYLDLKTLEARACKLLPRYNIFEGKWKRLF